MSPYHTLGSVPGEAFVDTTIFPGRDWFPQRIDEEMEAQEGK